MGDLKTLEQEILTWPDVSTHPHRFGGREFRCGSAEVGHIHRGGIVDIPLPRPIHDVLLAEGVAEEHRWVPNSGWVTFHIRREEDLKHALWLMRLSYVRYALKAAIDPRALLRRESEDLRLSAEITSLLEKFIPSRAKQAVAEPLAG
jgi:hypothetical protein